MSAEVKSTLGTSRVRQFEVYDMNKDKADDLVVVFENGELSVFYGTTRQDSQGNNVVAFKKNLVDESLKIKISSDARDDGGAIYYPGLPQLPDTQGQSQSQDAFLNESKQMEAQAKAGTIE